MGDAPRLIRIHLSDSVAVVANDGGLARGTEMDRLTLTENVPQAHKVVLATLVAGAPVIRYRIVIGHVARPIPAGAWVNESNLRIPPPPDLADLTLPSSPPGSEPPLEGYTFQGLRNRDGTVGTRNILAIMNTVQCVSGVVGRAVDRIRHEMLPRFPDVDDVVALNHTYGCGMAIDAPGAAVPIRTLQNIARNPNFADPTMVVSLGCEKLQAERLFHESFVGPGGARRSPGRHQPRRPSGREPCRDRDDDRVDTWVRGTVSEAAGRQTAAKLPGP